MIVLLAWMAATSNPLSDFALSALLATSLSLVSKKGASRPIFSRVLAFILAAVLIGARW